jgi:hypothetical protein
MSDEIVRAAEKPSWVQQFVDKARGAIEKAPVGTPTSYVRETGSTVGDLLEGGAVASLLGAAHAKVGLDTRGGPIDGWLAGVGSLASIGLSAALPNVASHARKIASQAFGIFMFRKAFEVVKHEPFGGTASFAGEHPHSRVHHISPPTKGPGVHGEDPIEAAAKGLG